MTKRNIDRHSIPAQLAAKRQTLAAATAEFQHQAYLHTQGDAGAAERCDELEREIQGTERDITRLEAAELAAGRVATAEDVAAAKRLHARRMKELAQLNTQIEQVSVRLVDQFASLHGPLVELRTLLRERGQTAWAVTAALIGPQQAAKRFRGPLDRLAGEDRASSLILASLVVSGIATTGPSLSPYLHLEPLDFGSPEAALERMHGQHAELMALVAVAASLANFAGTQSAGSTVASSGTSGTTSNNAAVTFPTPTAGWGTVVSMRWWDASTSGNAWICTALAVSNTISTGNAVSFPIGSLTFQIDN